jgi:hypothetical protein
LSELKMFWTEFIEKNGTHIFYLVPWLLRKLILTVVRDAMCTFANLYIGQSAVVKIQIFWHVLYHYVTSALSFRDEDTALL